LVHKEVEDELNNKMQIGPIPKAVNGKMKIGIQIRKILEKKKRKEYTIY